jgi:hypothetical protein
MKTELGSYPHSQKAKAANVPISDTAKLQKRLMLENRAAPEAISFWPKFMYYHQA